MTKPTGMRIKELKQSIEAALNISELPACVVEPIILSYWLQVKQQADLQTTAEEVSYKEELLKPGIRSDDNALRKS